MADSQPTIYDVAKHAGVSIATVSRALNSKSSVRPATRAKVFAAMEELAFVPNAVARRLSKGKHWVLGLVFTHAPLDDGPPAVEEASLLYTDIVIRGAESRAAAMGYSLLLRSTGPSRPEGMMSLMNLTGTVDGLIVLDQILTDTEANDLARRIPLVLLAGRGDSTSAMTVRVDNENAMISLAEHLVGVHGVERAGFVSGFDESPDSLAREVAFRTAIERLGGVVAYRDVLKADWTSGGGAAAMRQRMSLAAPMPEVFACANDQMAVGVIYALNEGGLTVPGDVAVTGFDDITLTRYFSPPLTTIRQSGNLLGEKAVDALVGVLDGAESVTHSLVLPTQLVVRRSCGCTEDGETLAMAASAVEESGVG
ncbi:MAG: LacI family DNA-binding transcriptional regulator [Acidimicrobiales bacterium]